MSKILNNAQAKAVYDAMCALNNVGGLITVDFPSSPMSSFRVWEGPSGRVYVETIFDSQIVKTEPHDNQEAFRYAYDLH